jgi:O-antigen/teichoic acid export membrane protein
MKAKEDLIKGSLSLSLAKFISNVVLAFSIIVVARLIGAANYGLYVFAISLVGLLNCFGGFGIGPYLSATLPKLKRESKRTSAISTTFWLNFLLSSALTFISFAFLPSVSSTPLLIQIASFTIILNLLFAYFVNLFISLKRATVSGVLTIAQSSSQAFSAMLLAFLGFGVFSPLLGLEIGYLVGSFLGFFFLAKLRIKLNLEIEKEEIANLFSFSSLLIISSIFYFFTSKFAIVYLSNFVSPATIGNIGIVQNFVVINDIIVATIASVVMPIFAEEENEKGRIFGIVFKYSFFLVFLPLLFLFVFPNFVITILFGKGYDEAIPYLRLFSIYLLFSFPSFLFSSFLLSAKRIKLNTLISIIGNLVLLILIPLEEIFKANGYFYALITSSFASVALSFFLLRKEIKIDKIEITKVFGISLLLLLFSYSLSFFISTNLQFFAFSFLLLFLYAISSKIIIKQSELKTIRKAIENSRFKNFLLPLFDAFWGTLK